MSPGFVADSSVGVAWAVFAQSSRATDQLLNEVAEGRVLVVPVLWAFEVGNALVMLTRRKRLTDQECLQARRALRALNPILDEDGPRRALAEIVELAERHGLTVYDAAYLELAMRKRLPLASRDAALNRAARSSGLNTIL